MWCNCATEKILLIFTLMFISYKTTMIFILLIGKLLIKLTAVFTLYNNVKT